ALEHREGGDSAIGLVGERLVRTPEVAGRQERLARLEVVRDRAAKGARAPRGRGGHRAGLHLRSPLEDVRDDGGEKIRGAGDRCVRRPLLRRDLAYGARGARQDRELALVVEE